MANNLEDEDDSARHHHLDAKQHENYPAGDQAGKNARPGGANSSGPLKARKKGVRKKYKQKLVKPLPKMKIVVKSTKTISFDENYEEDDSSDHNEESADEISHQSPQEMQEYLKTATEEEEEKKEPSPGFETAHGQASSTNNIQILSQNASDVTSNAKGAANAERIIPIESQQASSSDASTSVILRDPNP